MFLYMVIHGKGNRVLQEKFQHSGETISKHIHVVLFVCLKLSLKYIRPQDCIFYDIPPKIQNNRPYWPFFKNFIGVINGTHVLYVISPSDLPKFVERKGYPTQNILVVCDYDMCFTFAFLGWEGTTHDACVFQHALTIPYMNFPHSPLGNFSTFRILIFF